MIDEKGKWLIAELEYAIKLLSEVLEIEIGVEGEWADQSSLDSVKDKIRAWMSE